MRARSSRSVRAVLQRAMGLSAAFALVLMGGIFTLFSYDLEDVIFSRIVAAEADRSEPGHVPGITRYDGHAALPPWLAERLSPDAPTREYEVPAGSHGHFHVAVRPGVGGERQYFAFDVTRLTSTTAHLKRTAGLLLTSALLALLAAALLARLVARRLGRPLERMVEWLRAEGTPPPEDEGGVAEVRALRDALLARDARIREQLEREQRFNRDASHELRTPLAVAQGAVEILELDPPRDAETFDRLRRAVSQMGLLTEGILWLARERRSEERCDLHRVSRELLALYGHLRRNDEIELSIESAGEVHAPIPASVARVMMGNLLKNALAYTDEGRIVITIEPSAWTLTDTGVGFGRAEPGSESHGIGLSLVERLAQRFGWTLSIDALEPRGTRARLSWRGEGDTPAMS
ncbi:sensor histidine kinase [Corallococcus coralloides DSM 2259]|uniref:histidine kinase n=1 Tax=Corallococcus coralloides (strain ATCC 25202 / DSM 2259 / NBRC 100086 / M2) TaxID=1144275 RepID=H8MI09_CORCM|nr:HAMP domain-containing sensor histidine kinase [Corallococcus coralloides]AFE10073.1 sensor histidine kinase [Corallococcus coralloides DSM 2259]